MGRPGEHKTTSDLTARIESISRKNCIPIKQMEKDLGLPGNKLMKFKGGQGNLRYNEYYKLLNYLDNLEPNEHSQMADKSGAPQGPQVDPELAEQHSMLDKLKLGQNQVANDPPNLHRHWSQEEIWEQLKKEEQAVNNISSTISNAFAPFVQDFQKFGPLPEPNQSIILMNDIYNKFKDLIRVDKVMAEVLLRTLLQRHYG